MNISENIAREGSIYLAMYQSTYYTNKNKVSCSFATF